MREHTQELLDAQARDTLHPITSMEIFDTHLRWSLVNDNVQFANWPLISAHGGARMDMSTDGTNLFVAYTYGSNNVLLVYEMGTDGSATLIPRFSGHDVEVRSIRPSMFGDSVYWVETNAHRYDCNTTSESTFVLPARHSFYDHCAIAAVAHDEFYINSIYERALDIAFYDGSSYRDYQLGVDDDYRLSSMTYFDAVRMASGDDVILVNRKEWYTPSVILRRSGTMGSLRDIIPNEMSESNNYTRMGWLTSHDGILFMTGSIARAGTELIPQEMGVVLRSHNGINWTYDKYRYMGRLVCRTPLVVLGNFAYRLRETPGGTIELYRAPLTPIFGLDENSITSDHVHIELDGDDILSWNRNEVGHGRPGQINVRLRGDFTGIQPGHELRLYGGYSDVEGDHEILLNTYGVDSVSSLRSIQGRGVSLTGVEKLYKGLMENRYDIDWQWIPQSKHLDEFASMGGIYAIDEGYVIPGDDDEIFWTEKNWYVPESGAVKVANVGDRSMFISTVPFSTRNIQASLVFRMPTLVLPQFPQGPWLGYPFDETDQTMGNGAGLALVQDRNNFLAAYVDLASERLLAFRISADEEGDETWELLAEEDIAGHSADYDTHKVFMCLEERRLHVRYSRFSPDIVDEGGSWSINVNVDRLGETRLGILSSIMLPTMRAYNVREYLSGAFPAVHAIRHIGEFEEDPEPGENYHLETSSWDFKTDAFSNGASVDYQEYIYHMSAATVGDFMIADAPTDGVDVLTEEENIYYIAVKYEHLNTPHDDHEWWLTNYTNWGVRFSNGRAAGKAGIIQDVVDQGGELRFTIYSEDKERMPEAEDLVSFLPSMSGQAIDGGAVPPMGTWRLSGHKEIVLYLTSLESFDYQHEMTMINALRDIIAKSGTLDHDIDYMIDEYRDFSSHPWGWHTIISADIAATATVTSPPTTWDLTFNFGFEGIPGVHDPISYGARAVMDFDESGNGSCVVTFQYMDESDWRDSHTVTQLIPPGREFTVYRHKNFVSIWMGDRFLAGHAFHPIHVGSEYDNRVELSGWWGFDSSTIAGVHVTHPEIYGLVDAFISDQGEPPATSMARCIHNRRVSILPNPDGSAKITLFNERDNIGTIPDVIVSEMSQQSDRIPTYIRAIGADIVEYFDHDSMADYGVNFEMQYYDELDAIESRQEAARLIEESSGLMEGSRIKIPAQMHYEVGDRLTIDLVTFIGDVIQSEYVIEAIQSNISPGEFEATAVLRRLYDPSS